MPQKKKRANPSAEQAEADELQRRLAQEQDVSSSDDADDDDDDNGSAEQSDQDDGDDEDGLEGTYDGNEEIQVDFEGRNPIDTDFHGIRQLLQQLLLRAPINLSELADEIIGQNYVGSVVTQCEDDPVSIATANAEDDADDEDADIDETNTVFGITTAVNLTHKADVPCVQALRQHLLDRCDRLPPPPATDADEVQAVRRILTNPGGSVGFLLNERFVNIPPQISVPLLENLVKEVGRAAGKGMPYAFEHYAMLVKMYRSRPIGGQKSRKKSTAAAAAAAKPDDEFYTNAEEEIFVKHALCSIEYSVKGETRQKGDEEETANGDRVNLAAAMSAAAADADGDDDDEEDDSGLVPWRKLVIFEAGQLTTIIEAIKKFIEA